MSKCELQRVCWEKLGAAKAPMSRREFAVVVSEGLLPDGNFRAMVGDGTYCCPRQPVIAISSRDHRESYPLTMRAGAFDCLSATVGTGELERILAIALQEHRHSEKVVAWPEA